jgi:hypothetical protein
MAVSRCSNLSSRILQELTGRFLLDDEDSPCILTTPFLYPDNTPISFGIEETGADTVTLTDMGDASDFAFVNGAGQRAINNRLRKASRRFNVDLDGDELRLETNMSDVGAAVAHLIGAMQDVGYLLDKRASSSQSKDFTVDVESFLVRQGRRFVPRVRVDGFSQSVEVDYRVDGDNFNQLYLWVFDPARHKRQTERANTIALGYTDITRGVETGEGLRKARFAVIVNSQRDKLAPSANDDAMRILRSYLPNVATWETRHEIDELLAA